MTFCLPDLDDFSDLGLRLNGRELRELVGFLVHLRRLRLLRLETD